MSPAKADDLADVRTVLQTEIHLFAVYDASLCSSVYAPDVIWQNPFGVRLRSEAEVERFLTRLFQRPGYRSGKDTSAPVLTDVRLTGPESAVAWSEETSEGQIEDGKPLGLRKSHYLEVLRKRGGVWRVTDELIMDEK
jgi:ketosteroid isomerase-like protein